MAVRKSLNLLPGVFQTPANEKFLSATIDQLISEPNLTNLYGYIGRKFAPTFKSTDSYITEPGIDRQNYQLEPSVIVKNDSGDTVFFSSYIDFLNQIEYLGGTTNNHSRLFSSEYYSFDPQISYDKFVNFGQYYWLPNGPGKVQVNTSGIELVKNYVVTRNEETTSYRFDVNTVANNTIILARGGTYTFEVSSSAAFWIQSELGVDGLLNATPTISSRDVLGVENNGATTGTVTFRVPQKTAQDRFTQMSTVYNADYASPLPFYKLHNRFVSDFVTEFPQYAGITGSLDGKTVIFVDVAQYENLGEEAWTVAGEIDSVALAYDRGDVVPENDRYGVWKIQLITVGSEQLINAYPIQSVAINEKVYIKYGIGNANREFYKEYTGLFERMPLITAPLDTLYIQDGENASIYAKVKVVDFDNFVIDVDSEIVGQKYYTSPNGIEFTSGLKVQFDTDVTPAKYQNGTYYVENVGDGIRLVDETLLVTPEAYQDEIDVNYPLQRITLDNNTVTVIPAATTLTIGNVSVTTLNETPAGSAYITTLDDISDIVNGTELVGPYFVNGTIVHDAFRDKIAPDYITIKRDHPDLNSWSRNNRWFHISIIEKTAEYNNERLIFDQSLRAQRPIVQFEGDLQLYNYGRIGKRAIDILDTDITDAFSTLEGQVLSTAFGVPLVDGMRIIFAADSDPLVKNKIYVLNLVQYAVDANGLPTGDKHIKLTKADDGDILEWDTVCVAGGKYKGSGWWYNGVNWQSAQEKIRLNQDPLFEVYDYNSVTDSVSVSLSDTTRYPRSTFTGTKVFSYSQGSGANDAVLGFPLSYRSFTSQGDIQFANYFNTDTFEYTVGQTVHTKNVNSGFLVNIIDRNTVKQRNTWRTVVEDSSQYQLINYTYGPGNEVFYIDVPLIPAIQTTGSIPRIKVFRNGVFLKSTQYTFDETAQELSFPPAYTPTAGDVIDVQVHSLEASDLGYYGLPLNLDLNAQNVDIDTLTLGQVRNHLIELSRNSTNLVGDVLGPNNLRDLEIKAQGGTILQHSAPLPYAELFLLDQQANFSESVKLASREYSKFKNKFLELAISLSGINPLDPVASVDLILTTINLNKNSTFPWYYSDMIPYGTLKNTINYTVFDPLVDSYEITNTFSTDQLSNQAVLVYLNDQQLVLDRDYSFDNTRPAITFNSNAITLEIDDKITIVEYQNTDGCYVPETPSKIGAYPKFAPAKYLADTYRSSIYVIRGHDGSIMPAFGDYRDDFILELEKRIYNNIKLPETEIWRTISGLFPGKFRNTDYDRQEFTQVLSNAFLTWVGNNKIDFSSNLTFNSNDAFTWNYSRFVDKIDGEYMPGSWRSVYLHFYDCVAPHQRPWEMLGFFEEPTWWQDFYGPAPYTGSNKLLWDDLEAGHIRQGPRAGIDTFYARPGLSNIIPVDPSGFLLSPAVVIARATNPTSAAESWAVGDLGPTEYAWRTSSDWPYAVQLAAGLLKPAVYFSQFIDTYRIYYNTDVNQYLTTDNQHITQTSINFNGNSSNGAVVRSAGYLNWVADYLRNLGINPVTKITQLLEKFEVKLSYKMAGFSDKKYLQILAEQSSPTSTNDSVMIPNENYEILLEKSAPVGEVIYSAVIVEKTNGGYSVRGYNLDNPYFNIIPSAPSSDSYSITVLNATGIVYNSYQDTVLAVPYGYEFRSYQQVVDFLISYERYLIAQGIVFDTVDDTLLETRNWRLSVKELLFWVQQGWKVGSLIVLSPVTNYLKVATSGNIVDEVSDSYAGSKVVDQNYNLVKRTEYSVTRSPTEFSVRLSDDASVIAFVELDLVQYEHVLVFDNTTVFNDVIYKPELGNRQYRLKVIGQKTADWDGSLYAPGFIYNTETVQLWQSGKDYLKGDLISYKNRYYTALENVIASNDFNFAQWKQLENNEIKTGLLNNFSTVGVGSQSFYDAYGEIKDNDQLQYSHGLIGFKPRQYLTDLGLSETTQIEFYKGYIKQKGSTSAVKALNNAVFNNLNSLVDFYEEWAVRVGEYGALDSNPFIEIALDEKAYSVNPALAEFVGTADNNRGDGVTVFNQAQLYKSAGTYTGNIALVRDQYSDYDKDILTAGYVNIDDVDTTIFDLNNYTDLNTNITDIGTGYRIWTAKDFSGNWNVYRVCETNVRVETLSYVTENYINWSFESQHRLAEGELFIIRDFNDTFDGFYKVYAVVDLDTVQVQYQGNIEDLADLADTPITKKSMFYVLNSMRFTFMEDARVYGYNGNPLHQWQAGDKIWIDDDAPTSSVQGQPYDTGNHLWKVYEKTLPWTLGQDLQKSSSEYRKDTGYGKSVKLSYDGLLSVVGAPLANTKPWFSSIELAVDELTTGKVYTFDRNNDGEFVEGVWLTPTAGNAVVQTKDYGYSVDQSLTKVAIGAPGSYGNIGFVYVYNRQSGVTTYETPQVVWAGNLLAQGERFGTSISLDQTGDWLYVGAPGNTTVNSDKVYVYGLNRRVTAQREIISVNNENYLELSAAIYANIGDLITQPSTGAVSYVGANIANLANIQVTTIDGISTDVGAGNIYINNIDTLQQPIASYTRSITQTIFTGFTPNVANTAPSLTVSTSTKVYIPDIDYTVSGNAITFTSNIAQDSYVIEQRPYYTLHAVLQGTAGENFGYAMDSSLDGAQLGVGAPNANVWVDGEWIQGAGAVYVYDRVIEAFKSDGSATYTTNGTIDLVHRVTIDGVEISDFTTTVGGNSITLINPPPPGKVIFVETNQFNLLEKLIGIDSLEGGLSAIQANTAFGTSLTICSNNCAIYVGAPYYNNLPEYNTGAVWKFHHRGRLYGTNTGQTFDPVFTPGDTIRLDNYEVEVQGRMMPTEFDSTEASAITSVPSLYVSANVVTFNTAIRANVGQVISQNQGGGVYANVIVLANTAATGSKHITVGGNIALSGYTTSAQFKYGQSLPGANIVSVGTTITSAYPMASLDSWVQDINDANILGVSAINENGLFRLDSDRTVAKNLLRTLSGSNTPNSVGVFADAGMAIFAFMQIIVNPFNTPGEYFGNKVVLAQNAYMLVIASERGTTRAASTFDNNTTLFDDASTTYIDKFNGSGSVYIYELYDDPRDQVENPGRYAYAQQLNTGDLNTGDRFGADIDIIGSEIIVSAPSDDTRGTDTGSVYIFRNPERTRGWNLIRYQQPKVDVDSVNRIFLYSNLNNTILTNLEFIDPAKGKILGQADQEITYKTEYDPAVYNRGSGTHGAINTQYYWGANQVGQVWWNLSQVRFIDYEQDTLTYRSINWGRLFPGSVIEICEWVESPVLPSQYVAAGYNGTPLYGDNTGYVEITYVDPNTNIIDSKYYFWATGKTTVDLNDERRRMPISTVAEFIANPKAQGIAYAAIVQNNSLIVYNVGGYLSAQNTVLHLDYEIVKNNSVIHSEYELLTKGNPYSIIPTNISNKLIDSLAGQDQSGRVVPDPSLSLADRYGIGVRPRQSMFVDRLQAMTNLIDYVNDVLIQRPIAREFNLATLLAEDEKPSGKLNEFDKEVETEQILEYINTAELPTGYRVLVANDTTQDNLWVIYQLTSNKTWEVKQVQSYKTSLYWEYVDWYAEGFGPTNKLDYVVDTLVDAKKLPVLSGQEILVRVNTSDYYSGWTMYTVNEDLELVVVGIENGTLQLKPMLSDFANTNIGLDNQGFDNNRYDQNPNVETRYILQALRDDIFTNQLQGEFNKTFFVMVNYLFNEQKYVDWIFKTSFVSLTHYLRDLVQPANYIKDNVSYYEEYIKEVKPYVTKIREYLVSYSSDDTFGGDITDFDLAPYYDKDLKIFRSPSGKYETKDAQLWATGYNVDTTQYINIDYTNWYTNRTSKVSSIVIVDPGVGYSLEPVVTLVGGGADTSATATATIDGDTGAVTEITVISSGTGYTTTPDVVINGSVADSIEVLGGNVYAGNVFAVSTTAGLFVGMTANVAFFANAYIQTIDSANLKITMSGPNVSTFTGTTIEFNGRPARAYAILENRKVRSFDTTLKFDRVGYTSTVQPWAPNTFFTANTIVSYGNVGYKVTANITTGNNFISTDYVLYSANLFNNANDRIMAYYSPASNMPSKNLAQLVSGIEYPGVQVTGQNFSNKPGFSGEILANITFSGAHGIATGLVGNVITQPEADVLLNFTGPVTANIGQVVTQDSTGANVTVYGNINVLGTLGNVNNGTRLYAVKNTDFEFDLVGDIKIDGVVQIQPIFYANVLTPSSSYWANANIKVAETTIGGTVYGNAIPVTDASITVTRVWSAVKVQGTINSTTDFLLSNASIRQGNIKVDGTPVSVYPTAVDYVDSNLGVEFDSDTFDNVEYDEDGNPTLGDSAYDAKISSLFADSELGLRPEDINVDGGAFIDTYSSHAPEELVPGTLVDSLDMKVYTSNVSVSGGNVTVGYRIFNRSFAALDPNSRLSTTTVTDIEYYRISDSQSTTLTVPLELADSEIHVANASVLSAPNLEFNRPGVVFINNERIVYWRNYAKELAPWVSNVAYPTGSVLSYSGNNYILTANISGTVFDYANVATQLDDVNVLAQIRRGTKGTAIESLHLTNTPVVDAGTDQPVPSKPGYPNSGTWTPLVDETKVNATGQTYTFVAGQTYITSNVWYNSGSGNIITDGTGLNGATTAPALFLKNQPAGNILVNSIPDILTTEDAINTLTTESGDQIIEEDL